MPGRIPQATPPPGIVPNYEHPQDSGRIENITFQILGICIVSIFCIIRFYVRLFVLRKLEVSDATCLFSWALILLYSSTVLSMAHYGLGYYSWELSPQHYTEILKWLYASSIVYIPAAYFTRVTVLLMIAHIFDIDPRNIYYFITAITFAYAPIQGLKIFVCSPIKKYWDPTVTYGNCFDQRPLFITDTTIAIIADLIIIVLSIPLALHLDLPRKQKIKIILVLSTGGTATASCLYRLVLLIQFLHSTDVTAQFSPLTITPMVEITVGLSCTCLPSTAILCERLRSRWLGNESTEIDSRYKARTITFSRENGSRIIRQSWKASSRIASSLVSRTSLKNTPDSFSLPIVQSIPRPSCVPGSSLPKSGPIVQPEEFGLQDWGTPLDTVDGHHGVLEGWLTPSGLEGSDVGYRRNYPSLIIDWGDRIWDGSQIER